MNTCQVFPHSSLVCSACKQDPPPVLPWSAVIIHLRQAVMRSCFQCLDDFHHRQLLTSLLGFGFGLLKEHWLCTSSFQEHLVDLLEVDCHQSYFKSLNSWWKLIQCGSTRDWHQGFIVCFHYDWFIHNVLRGSFACPCEQWGFSSIYAYLVLVGVIARNVNKTGLQELSGWSWRILHCCTRLWISRLSRGHQTEFFACLRHFSDS